MARTIPTYELYIDWDNDGGLDFGNFELGNDDWVVNSGAGTTTAAVSTVQEHLGAQSLLITWNNVANPKVEKVMSKLIVGRAYTFSAWVFVPTGDSAVRLSSPDTSNNGTASGVTNAWTSISVGFTATATKHTLNINVNGTPANGDQVYFDQAMVIGPGENVSARALAGTAPSFRYGRDQARSLSAIQPGEITIELNNRSKDYSPDFASSPLFGYVAPGRPILVRATFASKAYDLFRGFLDDFSIDPSRNNRSVTVSATDILGRLADGKVQTALHPSLQTGQCIEKVLDAIQWPAAKRDIDRGATTVRWFWEDDTNGLDAIRKLTDSEGPPAFAFVSSAGNFVFRDRHHRLTRANSTVVQATFRDTGTEPVFSEPFSYDIGWRDLVNDVTTTVEEREPTHKQQVWGTDDVISIATNKVHTIDVRTDEPFTAAQDPELNVDYTVLTGAGVTAKLTRYSGQSTQVQITCTSAAVVAKMGFQATPVPVAREYNVQVQDQASIDAHGLHSLDELSLPWAGRNDAEGIAQIILGMRSERLPIVHATVVNANDTRTTQILTRDLSDRVNIIETQTDLADDFFIEKIEHEIDQAGFEHTAVFGCEKIQAQTSPLFTFNVAGRGFDQGRFGIDGFSDATTVFILDQSLLDADLLGY